MPARSSRAPVAAVASSPLEMGFERALAALAVRPDFWWLDSALTDAGPGRFSFAGADVAGTFLLDGAGARLVVARPLGAFARGRHAPGGDPLATLRQLLPPAPADAEPLAAWPFLGGAVGAFGYELGARFDPVPCAAGAGESAPELALRLVDGLIAHDAHTGEARVFGLGVGEGLAEARQRAAARLRAVREAVAVGAVPWATEPGAFRPTRCAPPLAATSELGAEGYARAVQRIRERIAEGDLYQACLTHRVEAPFGGDPLALHRALRRASPAPFAAFLRLPGDLCVVSSSPERFLRVTPDGVLESRPIKGTRARGATPHEDAALRADLVASPKDRAENVMIVDLVRHDLGRVCRPGSVEVPSLCAIASYATVHQMVSTVRGRLAPGRDALDALRAAFPPGSMTGAPKLAAMALLARLEPVRRGLYAGALGYLDARGGADLSVVIRSAFVRPGRLAVHGGGGIVADSDPQAEWEEACTKTRAVLEAAARVEAGEV